MQLPDNDYVEIILVKTPGYGESPTFEVAINSRGEVEYCGMAHVKNLGKRVGQIPLEDFARIRKSFERIGFPNLELDPEARGFCTEHITDMPSTTLIYKSGSKVNQVENYRGYIGAKILERLTRLEKRVFSIIGIATYTGIRD